MATFFSYSCKAPDCGAWGKIEFSTPNEELFELVETLVEICVDATKHRNRIEQIHKTMGDEE